MRRAITPSDRAPLAAILAVALFLGGLGFAWGLPGLDSWSNDDPSPRSSLRIGEIWLTDTHKYPYLQLGLDRLLYTPYLLALRAQGGLERDCRPLRDCFRDEASAMTMLMALSRLRSLVLFAGLVVAVFVFTRGLFGRRGAALWAALWAALTADLAFFAKLGNLDVPYLFWFMASMVAALAIVDGGRRRSYLAFGVLSAFALTTKDQIIGAYVLVGLGLLWVHARRVRAQAEADAGSPVAASRWLRRVVDIRLVDLVAPLVLVYALVNNLFLNWPGYVRHLAYYLHTDGESMMLPESMALSAELGQLRHFGRALAHAMGWPLLILGVLGTLLSARAMPRRAVWLVLPILSYYLVILVPVTFTDTRFALPVAVLACAGAGRLAARLWESGEGPARLAGRALVAGVAAYSLLYSLNAGLAMRADSRYAAEAFLRGALAPGDAVVAMDESRYLPRLETMALADLEFVDWRDITDPEEAADALSAIDRAEWVVLSDKAAEDQTGPAGALRDGLLDGSRGFQVAWEGDAEPPFDAWLPGAWVESRISPRVWVLRRGP